MPVAMQTLSQSPKREFLQNLAVFGGLSDSAMDRVIAHLRRRSLPAESEIVAEGAFAREMFVVEDGEVEVLVRREAQELVLAVLRRGACFGEMSLLDIQPRSATVRTRSPATLLVLGYRDVQAIQAADPEAFTMLVMNTAREVSRRLRLANQLLVDVLMNLQGSQRIIQELFGGEGQKGCPAMEVRPLSESSKIE